ncbi:MAG: HAD family hydrolase [Limisphaerales bacterium]
MDLKIKLISTDFDGTLFAEFENPPIPVHLQELLAGFQKRGGKWVINTGREMSSLMEALARAQVKVKPDHLVLVEREIYHHHETQYVEHHTWNAECNRAHAELFTRVRKDVPHLTDWVNKRFANATIYEDLYSPFCFIAGTRNHAEQIHDFLDGYCKTVPHLAVVRNDVYARFSHEAYNKGTALAELTRQLGIKADEILAAGDHLNDIPMLKGRYAKWLVAPSNAIDVVKTAVRKENGHVSDLHAGHGVAEGIARFLGNG